MRKFLTLLALASSFSASGFAAILYGAGSDGNLYQVTTGAGTWTSVNEGAFGAGLTITDIAEYNGKLYGNTTSALYTIAANGAATEVGTGFQGGVTNMVGLTFGPDGTLYGAEDGTTGSSILYKINTTTGVASTFLTIAGGTNINAAGDLEVIGNTMYVTTGGEDGVSSLASINLSTGVLTNLGVISTGSTQYSNVYGLSEVNGILYGFTSPTIIGTPQILSFGSTPTAAVTVLQSYGTSGLFPQSFYGTTDNMTSLTPEPGTLGVMALGVLGLGGLALRRRRG
jgi:hypothetical protein